MKLDFKSYSNKLGESLNNTFEQFGSGEFRKQFVELLKFKKNPTAAAKAILFLIGGVLTCISFAGLLLGYKRGYRRFMWPKLEVPRLHNLPLIVKVSMGLGVLFVWSAIILIILIGISIELIEPGFSHIAIGFVVANMVLCIPIYFIFKRWRVSVWNLVMEGDKAGTARFADEEDLKDYIKKEGLFIGGQYRFADKGHCLLCCGTRGGKSQNILMANVLYHAWLKGSMVYIDPKGEAAAICASFLRKMGKTVHIINPWELLQNHIAGSTTFNPLSLLVDKKSDHLIDDVQLLAELITPLKDDDKNAFFINSAREMIAGLLLHLVTSPKIMNPTLATLWEWLRLSGEAWDNLLADMNDSRDPINGHAVRMAASEIVKQMGSPETFSSIISNALTSTNFLKSLALQKSIVSGGLDPYSINDGNTVVFFVMPFDKLKSHSNYLRLVVTTLLRAVIRKPSPYRTTFICDEAFNLGYISEFETALSGYAGFNASLYLVYQDLAQVSATYGQKWESIMGNCTIRQFMSVKDRFSSKYCSDLMGAKTRVMYTQDWAGNITSQESSPRALATPDEVTRLSKDNIILFTGENPVAILPKVPYYEMRDFKDESGQNLYDPNPYVENSK